MITMQVSIAPTPIAVRTATHQTRAIMRSENFLKGIAVEILMQIFLSAPR